MPVLSLYKKTNLYDDMGETKMTMERPRKTAAKEIIWSYVEEVEAKLEAAKVGKFDPTAEKEAARKKDVVAKAAKIVERGILNSDITEEYEALQEQIADMKEEIKTLTEIDVKVSTLAALIEANNIELAEAQEAKDEIVAQKKAELAELQAQIDSLEDTRKVSEKEYTDNLNKTRKREEDDYKYKMDKQHRDEEDKWSDDLKSRKKILADQEIEMVAREAKCTAIEEENSSLKADVAYVETKIAEITKAAKDDAEKKMSTVLAIKEAAMKKEVTVDLQLVKAELANTVSALAKSEDKVAELEVKLNQAYKDMNALASTTVQASRPVYMERETNTK